MVCIFLLSVRLYTKRSDDAQAFNTSSFNIVSTTVVHYSDQLTLSQYDTSP